MKYQTSDQTANAVNPSSIQKVIADIIDLFELQVELLSVDSQVAKRKLTAAAICGSIAIPLGGSALTAVMVGCGFLLAEMTSLSAGGAMLIMGGVFFTVVAMLLFMAVKAIKAAADAMSETKSEFAENLRWLKATLVTPSTSARNQIRHESFSNQQAPNQQAQSFRSGRHEARYSP